MLLRRFSQRLVSTAVALHSTSRKQQLCQVQARWAATVDGSRLRLEAALRDAIADGDPEAAAAAATALAMRNQRTKLAEKATPADRDTTLARKQEDSFRIDVDVRVVDTSFVDVFADNEGVEESALEEASQQLLAVFMHYFSHEIDATREAVRFHVREALQAELDAAAAQGEEDGVAVESAKGEEDSSALLTALRRRVSAEAGIAVRVMPLLASSHLTSIDAMTIVRSAATDAAVDEALAAPVPKSRRMRTAPLSRAAREARPRLLEALRSKILVGALAPDAEAELAEVVQSYIAARKQEGANVPTDEARDLLLRDATARARRVALAGQKRAPGNAALAGEGDEQANVPAPVTYDVGFHDEVRDQLSGILGALAGRAEAVETVADTVSRRVLRQLNDSARRGAQADVLGGSEAAADEPTSSGELTPLAQAARDQREAARARVEVAKERDQSLALPLPPFGSIMRLRVAFVPRPAAQK